METLEVKLPHHLSKLYKKMEEEGLIVDRKYVGEVPLGEYLRLQEGEGETPNPEEPNITPITPQTAEATIPVSKVAEMIAEAMKGIQTPAPSFQTQEQPVVSKEASNIDDIPELRNWEMKDREYEWVDEVKPISASIAKEHTKEIPLQYTNKEKQTVHILRYATNQPSFFVEKQSKEPGSVLVQDIIFNYGRLKVPASNVVLQQFLAIHPHKNVTFKEYDPLAKSRKVNTERKLKIQADNLVLSVGDVINRAIASIEFPNYVDSWSSEILEEQIFALVEKNPQKYIDYTNDSTIKMKGVIKSAMASGDLIYSNYRWMNKRREVIVEVAKNQNEMDEMVLYFESGIGRTFYEYLLNQSY